MTSKAASAEAILNSKEACEYLKMSKASLSRAVAGKLTNTTKLPAIWYGRVFRFRLTALDQWLRDNEQR
jgi:excisionase family DNA binding protein